MRVLLMKNIFVYMGPDKKPIQINFNEEFQKMKDECNKPNILNVTDLVDYFKRVINSSLHLPVEPTKQYCPRCNNKLEYIESNVSIFSPKGEQILKCNKCGWC